MFILTDAEGVWPIIEAIEDGKDIKALDSLEEYKPEGDFHIVATVPEEGLSRWQQLRLATLGARHFTATKDEDSPLYAGEIPTADKLRKVIVDATNAETRAGLFAKYKVNYIGRTKLDPRNIFVIDNKKDNPLHDPSKDATLEALYASLPDDWWGSAAIVSSSSAKRLEAFFEAQENAIPITWTSAGTKKLNFFGREFVWVNAPKKVDPEYGIEVRNLANRLSYELSLPPKSDEDKTETPVDNFNWGI